MINPSSGIPQLPGGCSSRIHLSAISGNKTSRVECKQDDEPDQLEERHADATLLGECNRLCLQLPHHQPGFSDFLRFADAARSISPRKMRLQSLVGLERRSHLGIGWIALRQLDQKRKRAVL